MVELAPLLSAICDQIDHKFQPSYQNNSRIHKKMKTGDD
jgi:hypothetical protein